jgi:hypothetical protein
LAEYLKNYNIDPLSALEAQATFLKQKGLFQVTKYTTRTNSTKYPFWRWTNFILAANAFFWNAVFWLAVVVPWSESMKAMPFLRTRKIIFVTKNGQAFMVG